MAAQIKELKTNRTLSKEGMLSYLDDLKNKVSSDEIESLIFIFSDVDDFIRSHIIGDVSFAEAIGMIDTAKLAFQMNHFHGGEDDDE